MRAAIYARYSSENQRDASVEDQIRLCNERIKREGWTLVGTYTDRAVSGASALRPGYQKLLQDIRAGRTDIVVAEALDRISRDQEHVAGFYKQLTFEGVKIITLAEGDVSELHVGLKGTMNALFLKDLAAKTHRGLRGRVEDGRSGGGLCFGYSVKKEFDSRGEPVRGGREINAAEAKVVNEIFSAFANGESPLAIAKRLNRSGVAGPLGKPWGPSTIYGNWRRGTGILNNELYLGRIIWNRLRYLKDPSTGKRVSKLNARSEWIIKENPELQIVSQELWDRAKVRQSTIRTRIETNAGVRSERARRGTYLFSGMIRCGVCGGGFIMANTIHYGCNNARTKGTCSNKLSIRRDQLEAAVLHGLKNRLMRPDLLKEFVAEYHRELNRLRDEADAGRQAQLRELQKVDSDIRAIIESVKAGFRTDAMREELESLEAQKLALKANLKVKVDPVRLHPNLATVYQDKIEQLHAALNDETTRVEASTILRQLVEEIRLVPEGGQLRIHLTGALAQLLVLAQNKKPGLRETGLQVTMVAGAGFEPTTFRL